MLKNKIQANKIESKSNMTTDFKQDESQTTFKKGPKNEPYTWVN